MEKDPRGFAGSRMHADRVDRGDQFCFFAGRKQATSSETGANQIPVVKGDAPVKEVIVPVTFRIPGALRQFTGGQSSVRLEHPAGTLADALYALSVIYPGVRDRITTEQGQIREHINIFIGDEDVRYTGGLMSPVAAGSEISIVPAISGGCRSLTSADPRAGEHSRL